MPSTAWEDIAGEVCDRCGLLASHYYGGVRLCCDCHAGMDQGLCNREDTAIAHLRIALRKVLENPSPENSQMAELVLDLSSASLLMRSLTRPSKILRPLKVE